MEKKKTKKETKNVKEKSFFTEVKDEIKKVKFPSKEVMTKYTVATVGFLIIFGLYFYVLDLAFSWIKGITG